MVHNLLSFQINLSGPHGVRSDDCTHYFRSSRSDQTGKAQDFSLVQRKGNRFYIIRRNILYLKEHVSDLFILIKLGIDISKITAYHHLDHIFFVRLRCYYRIYVTSILEDCHLVCDPPNLIHSVGYIDHNLTLRFQLFNHRKEAVDLCVA